MTRPLRTFSYGFFLVSVILFSLPALAQVTVTPATTTAGVKICEQGSAAALTDIKITEGAVDDIGGDALDHPGVTLVLEAPSGFSFENGAGTASVAPGADVSNVSITSWTASNVTITLDAMNSSGPHAIDELTISGLRLLATSGTPQTSVNVTLSGSGTASVTGLSIATLMGTVSSTVNTALGVSVNYSTICPNQGVNVTIASSESGISYTVFDGVTSLSSSNSGTGSNLVITTSAVSNTAAAKTLKVIATDAAAGCSTELQQQQNVTVAPVPTANAGGTGAVCLTAGSYAIASATSANGTIAWTHNGSGTLDNTTIIHPTYTFNPADAGTVVTFTLTVTGPGSCPSATDTFALTITAPPTANAGSDEEICFGQTFNFNSQSTPATATQYANVSWTTTGTGTLNNANTLIPNYIPAVNESGLITFTLTAQGNGSCANATDQMVLNVYAKPTFTVSNTTAVPFCSGGADAITLNSSTPGAVVQLVSVTPSDPGITGFTAAGATYNSFPFTITDIITNATTSIQTLVYEFEVSVAGCANPARKTATVNVRPIPNLTVTNNIASPICSSGSTDIDLTDPTSGVVISVTNISISPTPAGITGYSPVNSTFANGSKVTNVLVNTTNVQQTITYTFRSSANGCTDPSVKTATVVVQPSPVFTLTNSAASICSGGTTAIQLGSTSSGAVVKLVNVIPSDPGLTGFDPIGTTYATFASPVSNTLTNATTSVQTVVYEFEVSVPGCVNPVHKTATVTVRPIPDLTVTNNIASPICSGGATNIDLTDPTSGVVITVTGVSVSPTPGGVTGFSPVNSTFANGSKVTNVLVNTTSVQQTITYTFRSSANGCTDPASETATVVVEPSPAFTLTNSSPSICSVGTTSIQLSSTAPSAVIELVSATPSNAGVTGFTNAPVTYSAPFPVTISDVLTNTTASAQTVVYDFQVKVAGCVSPVHRTATVTINPTPALSITNNSPTIASGKNTNIDLFDATNGVVIRLETISTTDPSVSGYSSVGSTFANGSKVTDVLINSTSNPQNVTYGFRSSANGCADSNLVNVTVTINPGGVFAVTNGSPQICSGSTTLLTINSPTTGATVELVSVTPSNASITGFAPANTVYNVFPHVIADVLTNPTNAPESVIYEFEVSVGGTPNPVHEFVTVRTNPTPALTISNTTPSICSGVQTDIAFTSPTSSALITLTSVTPGGVTGNSTAGTTFASGSHLRDVLNNATNSVVAVTYHFDVSANGCSVSGFSTTVNVAPSPDFTVTNHTPSLCSTGGQNIDLTTSVDGAKITVTGVTISPAAAGVTGVLVANTQYTSPFPQTLTGSLVNTTNVVQTVTYEFEMAAGSCVNPVRQTVTIQVSPTPSMSVVNTTPSVCSGSATAITLNSPTSGAIITLTSVNYGGANGNLSNNTTYTPGSVINDILQNLTTSPVTVNYTFEVSANGCTSGSFGTSVSVAPTPTFTVVNNATDFCSSGSQDIDLTTTVSGATITITGVTVSPTTGSVTGVATAGTQYSAFFPGTQTLTGSLVNTTNTVQTVTYEFEMSTGSCVNPTRQTASVVVYPAPSMSITNTTPSMCSEGYTNITLNSPTNGAVITLTNVVYGGVSGSLSNNTTYTPGSLISELLQNTTSGPVTVTYTFEVSANGCTASGYSTSVVVNPNPDFTVTNSNPVLCHGTQTNISFASSTSGHQINVVSVNYGVITGGTVVAGTTVYTNGSVITETLTNTTNAPIDVVYTFNVTTPGSTPVCPVAPVNKQVVVRVQPELLFTYTNATPFICSGTQTNITLLTNVTGSQLRLSAVNYNGISGSLSAGMVYSNNQKIAETLVNNSTSPITVSYTIESTIGACTSASLQVIQVVVNPIPKLSSTLTPVAICSGTTFSYGATSLTPSAAFTWSRAAVPGISQTASSGNGDVNEVLTNTTNFPINVTYIYVTSANGCTNSPGQSVVVTVNPIPSLSSVLSASPICSGGNFIYTATSATSGAVFNWSRASVAGISQGAASGSGNVNEVLTNTTASPVVVTYVYVVSANGCTNSPGQNVTVTVQPVPSVVDPADQVVCAGTNTTLVDFSSTGVGTNYNWVNDTPSIGLPAGGSGNIAAFNALNSGSTPVVATITVTPLYASCTGAAQSFTITVNPAPTVNAIADQVVCAASSTTAITFGGVATTYDWTNTNSAIGLALSGTGVTGIPAFTANNTGNTVQVATITVTPRYVNGAVTCLGVSRTFTITVNPIPDASTNHQDICSGQTTNVLISNPNGVSGTTYSWTIGTVTGAVSGHSAGSGTVISQTLTSAAGGVVEYLITPSANGCAGATVSVTVNVNSIPVGNSIAAGAHVVCSGTTLNITPTSNVGSATYTWSGSNGSGGSGAITDSPVNTTNAPIDITYTIVPKGPAPTFCTGSSFTIVVTVNPNPTFTITNTATTICSGVTPAISVSSPTGGAVITLQNVNYGALTNGTYSGGGVFGTGGSLSEGTLINSTNNPIVVTYTFTITTSTSPSCPVTTTTQSTTVTVEPSPSFTINNVTPSICSGSKTDITLNTPVSGGQIRLKTVTYGAVSGTLSAGAIFNNGQKITETLLNTTNAPVTVQYEFESIVGSCGPGASTITTVTVNPNPTFTITNSTSTICSGTSPTISVASPTSGAVISLQSVNYGSLTNGAYSAGGTFGTGGSLAEGNLVNTTNNAIVVIYTFSVSTPTSPSCPLSVPTQSTAVIVEPAPSFTLTNTTASICSSSKTDITLNTPVSGGQIRLKTVTYGAVSGTLSAGAIFNNGQKITETLLNTTNSPVTVQYEFESIVGSCGPGASTITTVTVNPNPTFTITNSTSTICSGTSPTISVASPTSGAVISLQSVNYGSLTNGAYSAGGTFGTGGSLAEGNLVNTTNNAIVVIYTFSVSTPTSPSCPLTVTTQSTTVTVEPSPSFTINNVTPSICSGSKTDITLNTPVTGGQVRLKSVVYGAVSGTLAAGVIYNNNQKIAEVLSNTTNSPVTVQYEFESIVGSCGPGASTITTVTVNPNPTFTITNSTSTICSGTSPTISVASPTSGAVISLQSVNYGSLTNGAYSAGGTFGTGGSLAEGNLVNTTNNAIVVIYTFSVSTPTIPSCPLTVTTQSTTVTVEPSPSFTINNVTPSICSGSKTDITLNTPVTGGQVRLKSVVYGAVSGTLAAGAIYNNNQKIEEVLSNTTNSPVTVQYEFESIVGSCGPGASTITMVTVNPNPTFTITNSTSTICSGTSPTISVASPTSGAVISLQSVNYGSLTNGAYSAGGTFGTGGNLAEGNLVNTTNNAIVVTYTFSVSTPTSPSCPLSVTTQSTTVIVQPAPSFTLTNTTASICSGSKTDITLNTPVSGGQIRLKTVTYGAVSGTLSAGAIFNNGQKITETLLNTTNAPVTVQYEFESIVGSCGPGASTITTVTVNPNPTFTITNSTSTICSGTSPTISVASPTSGAVISLQSVNYGSLTNGAYSAGGTFGTGGSLAEGNLVNTTNNAIVVIYTFSVSTPTSPSCPLSVPTQSTAVIVEPAPSFTLTNTTASICSGSKTDITLNTPVSGGQIRLKTVTYGAVTGSLTAGALFVNSQKILETLTNATNSPVTVQYEFESMVGSCGPSTTITTNVIVNPNPSFSITNTTVAICSGTSPSISVTSPTSGAVITLQNVNYGALTNGAYVSGGTFGTGGALAEGNLTNTTSNSITVTYTFRVTTPTTPSCPLTVSTQTTTVIVDPIPTVSLNFNIASASNPPQVAENDPSFKVFGNQKGGLFTITPGIGLGSTLQNPTDEAVFDPSAATIYDGHPSTLNTITYTYTNETGCTNSISKSIIVNAITDIDFGVDGATLDNSGSYNVCAEQGQVKLLGFPSFPAEGHGSNFESLTAGLTIKFDGVNYFIETNGLAANTYSIKYSFTNINDATSTKIRTVKILASPLAKFVTSNNCIVSDVMFTDQSTVNNAFGAAITGWQWNFGDGNTSSAKDPAWRYSQSDTYFVTLKVTTNEGCSNTSGTTDHPLRVGDVPEVNYDWTAICTNDFTNFVDKTTKVVGSTPPGISQIVSYTWDFGDGDVLTAGIGNVPANQHGGRTLGTYKDPKHNYQLNGVYDAVLTVSTNDGCTSSKIKKVSILPGGVIAKPTPSTPYLKDFEADGAGWIAEPQAEGGNTSWIWGTPTGITIKSAASGSKAWWTGRNQTVNNEVTYYSLEHSQVNGPCFDLTSLDRPMVSLDYWSDSEKDIDGAVLQYSTNGGLDWIIVGPAAGLADRDQGVQWFNSSAIISNPGTQAIGPYGWSNRLGKWINGRFNLDIIPANLRSQVRLRVAFSSNDGNVTSDNQTFDGFAFDNVFVGNKQRNVLIEHFTDSQLQNTGESYIDKLQNDQLALYNHSDFNDIRYHISSSGTPDPLAQDNQADPGARATYMGVSRPPTTLLDGILNSKFTGKYDEINLVELDRRALKDPAFDLALTVVPGTPANTLKVNLTVTAKAAHSDPLIVQVVLIENTVSAFRNVLRKALFGSDGQTISNSFVAGQAVTLTNTNNEELNVPIVNSGQLSLIAYVQNKNTKEIYQSIKIASPPKTGRVVVGLEEEVIPTTLNGISIYPNPANQVFYFGIPDPNTTLGYTWKLSDQRGVVVRSGDFENAINGKKQVDVSGLPNAVYFVILTGPGHSVVYRKLVIMNSSN